MYFLSVLAQFKNETMNLKVWIEHYLWQGVDHFYLVDNGSTDNPLPILQEYINKGIVSYYYKPEKYRQIENYRWVFDYEKMKTKSYWLAVCDLDEFFYGVDQKLRTKIQQLNNYDLINVNWLVYGNSGIKNHPQDIRTTFVHRFPNIDSLNTKYIFKPLAIKNSSQIWIHWLHYPNTSIPIKQGNRVRTANQLIKINHYVLQSLEYFNNVKSKRGDAASANDDKKCSEAFFDRHNNNATFLDNTLKNLIETPLPNY
jgi:Domain of unknown function.